MLSYHDQEHCRESWDAHPPGRAGGRWHRAMLMRAPYLSWDFLTACEEGFCPIFTF